MTYKNNSQLDDLIRQAGQKAGVDPASLKNTIDSGKLLQKMNPKDAQRLEQVLGNPQLAQQMLNTPQAKKLIQQFMK